MFDLKAIFIRTPKDNLIRFEDMAVDKFYRPMLEMVKFQLKFSASVFQDYFRPGEP